MNALLRYAAIVTAAALLLAFAPTPQAQVDWTMHPDNPVIDAQGSGWDGAFLLAPSVVLSGDTLKMWYTGVRTLQTFEPTAIGYAWSLASDGATWTRRDAPVLSARPGQWDDPDVTGSQVLVDGDTLRMWYGGGDLAGAFGGMHIGYATSTDGINWDRHPTPVMDPGPSGAWNDVMMIPGAVIKEDGLFKMWFSGWASNFFEVGFGGIGYATSPDGITWTLYDDPATTAPPFQASDPVVHPGPTGFDLLAAWGASVRRTDTGYEMWYSGLPSTSGPNNRIGYATSPDGLTWTKYEGNPVLTPNGSGGAEVFDPTVVLDGELYRMWFVAARFTASGISYATAPMSPVAAEPGADPSEALALYPPHPNPAAGPTTLAFRLDQPGPVTLTVHDLLGREVARLVDGARPPGEHTVTWDGGDGSGVGLGAGVYLVRLRAGDETRTRKVLLLR